jgi:hypothetical protein
MSSAARRSGVGRVVRALVGDAVTGDEGLAGFAFAAAGDAGFAVAAAGDATLAVGAAVTGFAEAGALVVGFAVAGLAVAGRLTAATGFVEPAGLAGLAVGEAFALAAGDPTAVVRARATFGFGLVAAWSGVVELAVGSGRVVWSAMLLA